MSGPGKDTLLELGARLPLTCTRSGSCCHRKAIWVNPWELACLARAKRRTQREFRDRETTHGGIRLRVGTDAELTCGQYDPAVGCTVHAGRPLACRLYPLGRRREGEAVRYLHPGAAFPCLQGCPEVTALPALTVADYLAGQEGAAGEVAQDAYVELTLDLAEAALVLFLEGGLAASGDTGTLPRWLELGGLPDAERAALLPPAWLDALTIPELETSLEDPAGFAAEQLALLQSRPESSVAEPATPAELRATCQLLMASSLHLGRATGIDPRALSARWVATAKEQLGSAGR